MMSLVPSMLRSLVEADGEALVIHAGEKPYVVASAGQVELANRPLTMDAVKGIVSQLLPRDVSHALDEFGAVQHEIVSPPEFPGESFVLVAARGNDDIWVEIRRRKPSEAGAVPEAPVEPAAQQLAIAATVRRGAEAARRRRMPQHVPADPVAIVPPTVVLPMPRGGARSEGAAATAAPGGSGLDRLLRIAAARGASTLYLSSNALPAIRVDGELRVIEGEPSLAPQDLESWLRTDVDWTSDVDGVGRVRCTTFQDERGTGAVFRLMPARAMSAEQLGLPGAVESLAFEPGGLVLVTGPRLSGKRTVISALVDLMNRRRRVHVVTIESEIAVVHGPGTSIISQREARGGTDDVERAARAALHEDPDVLVIESLHSAQLIDIALEGAASGQLVIGGLPARDTASALARILNSYPAETRWKAQLSLAEHLRGVVAQVLLQKRGGGLVAAREILLNTTAIASVIAEGRTSQLAMAIDAGQGMQRLNDVLAGLVQNGAVEVSEAFRKAADRSDLLVKLKRLGVDTSTLDEGFELR
jgi:twitching motility protein PilT